MNTITHLSNLAVSWLARLAANRVVRLLAPLVVIGCLTLAATHPLSLGTMPLTEDGMTHVHRLITFDHSLQHGLLWPRYVAAMAFGYGAPSFNFYSPVSLYPAEILHLLGMSFIDALLCSLILYIWIGALGFYTLGRTWSEPLAGIGMATAFVYAPYMIYDLLHRGAIAEYAALALLPWSLWAFLQAAWYGRRRDILLTVFFFGWAILIHNITALTSTAILVVYSLYLWRISPIPARTFTRLLLIGVLALGLTAFFWLPALGEAQYAQLGRMDTGISASPDSPSFGVHFQSVWQTLAWPETVDFSRFKPTPQRTLGWPQILLSLLGIGLAFWKKPTHDHPFRLRSWSVIAVLIAAFAVFMITPASTWVWLHVSIIRPFQFPWRMLGPATLMLATLAGLGMVAVVRRVPWQVGRIAWVVICLACIILYSMPWLYRPYLSNPPASSIVDSQNYERSTGAIAGAAYGDFLPRWVIEVPDRTRLIDLYAQSEVIPRLQPLPDVVTVEKETWDITSGSLTFSSIEDTTLTFYWFYFPGWWAKLDGQPVDIFPTEPNGFIGINTPAGKHTLDIALGLTPLQLAATMASCVFLALLLGLLIFVKRLWQPAQTTIDTAPVAQPGSITLVPMMVAVVAIGLSMFLFKILVVDIYPTPIKRERFAEGAQAGLQTPIEASFEGQIELMGYDLASQSVKSGQTTNLTLYWRPISGSTIAGNYSSVIALRDSAGMVVAQVTSSYPGGWRTTDFQAGHYIPDQLDLLIPPGTPPAQYKLEASLYWVTEQRSLSVSNVQGTSLGVTAPLGTLEVTCPSSPASADTLAQANPDAWRNAPLTDDVQLLSAGISPSAGDVGQQFILLLGWLARQKPSLEYSFQVLWLDGDGQQAAVSPAVPPTIDYPTDQWREGDVWRGVHSLYIPGSLEAGTYQVAIQLVDLSGQTTGERALIGTMIVNTPPRSFDVPSMGKAADIVWQGGIRLLGYDLSAQSLALGENLDLTLYWQADEDINTSLTVFVHIYDGNGTIVAQQDAIPLSGTRPTTGWAPGEVITDHYAIPIPPTAPPGSYLVRVGLYDAATSVRARLLDGSEFWRLTQTIQIAD